MIKFYFLKKFSCNTAKIGAVLLVFIFLFFLVLPWLSITLKRRAVFSAHGAISELIAEHLEDSDSGALTEQYIETKLNDHSIDILEVEITDDSVCYLVKISGTDIYLRHWVVEDRICLSLEGEMVSW
ncbi:hypothetical protein P3T73_02950 [Kiritimatiellota bacterium B12222]|nr:hypothetical protein P3T73_02950 [Kiritimatiellota bacterium B12222]